MKSIAIIPARGGSKRIPRKNIRPFLGKPILAYSIDAALKSCVFDEVMVSTDDHEIAEIARYYGAAVPFLRSAETATDMAGTAEVLIEVVSEYYKRGYWFDTISCIYPCAPFVTAMRLQEGLKKLQECDCNSVVPVVRFSYPPQRSFVLKSERLTMTFPENLKKRSQDMELWYHDAGQFYFIKRNALLSEQSLFGTNIAPLILSETEVQDIDTEDDWSMAEVKYKMQINAKTTDKELALL